MHGDFTWIDLSTFDVAEAKSFYSSIFDWDGDRGESGYLTCFRSGVPAAGLDEMPEFFQEIKMPSFWMSYISVSDIATVVTKATALGGRVELEETNALGRVTLIWDPAGAGFTCYEGDAKSSLEKTPQHGRWCWSELFVSDLSKIKPFYTELFGWSFENDAQTADHWIANEQGKRISAVQVASNDIKGDKEFWGVFFSVRDTQQCLAEIQNAGGKLIYEHTNASGDHYLANDSQGAAFFITSQSTSVSTTQTAMSSSHQIEKRKWRSLVGLMVVYLAILLEANWLWGALFLLWVIPDLKTGTTYFIEPLSRSKNPVLYWAVILTWIGLSIYLLLEATGVPETR